MRVSHLFDHPGAKAIIAEAEADAAERFGRLTAREREVLALITDGRLNKETAHELGISPRTVENHRLRLMEKVGVKTFAQLVRLTILAGD
jgi:two-component system response regulator FixJ